jgi:hypothetical protein
MDDLIGRPLTRALAEEETILSGDVGAGDAGNGRLTTGTTAAGAPAP